MPAWSPNLAADISHLERILWLTTRLITGIRHLPYERILQRLSRHSLQRWGIRADLITALKIFTGLLDVDPDLFLLPPTRRGLRRHHLRGSLWKTKISSRLPSHQLFLSMFSRIGWKTFGQKSFPISPIDWTLIPLPPTHLHATH